MNALFEVHLTRNAERDLSALRDLTAPAIRAVLALKKDPYSYCQSSGQEVILLAIMLHADVGDLEKRLSALGEEVNLVQVPARESQLAWPTIAAHMVTHQMWREQIAQWRQRMGRSQ